MSTLAAVYCDVLSDGGAHEVPVHVHVSILLQLAEHAQVFERYERRYTFIHTCILHIYK